MSVSNVQTELPALLFCSFSLNLFPFCLYISFMSSVSCFTKVVIENKYKYFPEGNLYLTPNVTLLPIFVLSSVTAVHLSFFHVVPHSFHNVLLPSRFLKHFSRVHCYSYHSDHGVNK